MLVELGVYICGVCRHAWAHVWVWGRFSLSMPDIATETPAATRLHAHTSSRIYMSHRGNAWKIAVRHNQDRVGKHGMCAPPLGTRSIQRAGTAMRVAYEREHAQDARRVAVLRHGSES